jgi:4-hydroxybenzoate polyprenyltransferase
MFETVKLAGTISRAEFILPNLGSLIMGLAWGVSSTVDIASLVVLLVISFTVINLSSAIGAQVNTYCDHELDSRDERKKQLVKAMDSFGRNRLKGLIVAEFLITAILVSLFTAILGKPILLVMWLTGIFLGWAYSAPPLRLKARSWIAPVVLILVLAVFPVLFAYFAFAVVFELLFLLSLAGLASTVYGVIVPTEIRDYFGDKEMGIITMTVRLGLVKASLLGIGLLVIGAILTETAFLIRFFYEDRPLLIVFLLPILVAVLYVLSKFRELYLLSKEYARSGGQSSIADRILNLSANNPRWIMMVTQAYSLVSIVLLVSKFLI